MVEANIPHVCLILEAKFRVDLSTVQVIFPSSLVLNMGNQK